MIEAFYWLITGLVWLGLIGLALFFVLTGLQFVLSIAAMVICFVVFIAMALWKLTCKFLGIRGQEPNAGPELQIPTAVREVDFDSPLDYCPVGAERPQFSVCFFFQDGTVRNFVRGTDCQTAIRRAKEITEWPGAKDGSIKRVIITNGKNDPIFEWTYGQGVTFAKYSSGL
jgi:hypothetical protein